MKENFNMLRVGSRCQCKRLESTTSWCWACLVSFRSGSQCYMGATYHIKVDSW